MTGKADPLVRPEKCSICGRKDRVLSYIKYEWICSECKKKRYSGLRPFESFL